MASESIRTQRPPWISGAGIERKNWPDGDPIFKGLAAQLDHCEFIHRKLYPECRGCPVFDLCNYFIDAVSDRQSQNQNIRPIDITLYYKILNVFSAMATRGNGHV